MKLRILFATFILVALLGGETAQSDDSGDLVLVAGATGRTGRAVVEELLARGYNVRAFVRDIERARTILPSNIEFSEGDVQQRHTIDPALVGVDALISTIGASFSGPKNGPELVDYGGVKALVEAAADANLKHFLLVSSGGVTDKENILNQRFGNVLIWKFKGEEAVRNSGVPYTIVRPGGLTNEPGGKTSLLLLQGDEHQGRVPRADVARVLVAALTIPDAKGKTFELFGTEEASPADLSTQFSELAADSL